MLTKLWRGKRVDVVLARESRHRRVFSLAHLQLE